MQQVDRTPAPVDGFPHVVIVGAGFGGLACAGELGGSAVRVTVIDRRNYHLFIPLLYQVATAALSPADISEPIRHILARHRNVDVVLGEVVGVDAGRRVVNLADGGVIPFDYLVVATGSTHGYFGKDHWAEFAPGLKTVEDARRIRSRVLLAFERAETTPDVEAQDRLLTMVVVGGGPTGVEMAGALAELARFTLARDFRRIDPRRARVILVEAGPRILAGFPEDLSTYARGRLERLGVTVMTNQPVQDMGEEGVTVGGKPIPAGTIVWGAGVKASEAGRWLGVETDRAGRIKVEPDLSVPGLRGVYALGDVALALGQEGKPLPGLAQVAKQQGQHLGRALAHSIGSGEPLVSPFEFRNRGNTAIVGRNAAVFDFGRRKLTGFPAWLLWAVVHVWLLVGFEKRLLVTVQWLWRYATYQRGARLITEEISKPAADSDAAHAGPARERKTG